MFRGSRVVMQYTDLRETLLRFMLVFASISLKICLALHADPVEGAYNAPSPDFGSSQISRGSELSASILIGWA